MNSNIVVALTPRRAGLVRKALVEYVKHVCKDDCCTDEYELREIDRLIGYSGELEGRKNMTNIKEQVISFPICNGKGVCHKCKDFNKCLCSQDSFKLYHLENKKLKWEGDNGNK